MALRPVNFKYQRREEISVSSIGPVYAEIELSNSDDLALNRHGFLSSTEVRAIRRRALVNGGEMELIVNQEIKQLLDLPLRDQRIVRFADESLREVEIVGPVEVRFENHSTIARAVVVSDAEEILLGRIIVAGLGVFIDPESKELRGIPERPIKRVA